MATTDSLEQNYAQISHLLQSRAPLAQNFVTTLALQWLKWNLPSTHEIM